MMKESRMILTADMPLPLSIGDPISLAPVDDRAYRFESRIIGARHHEFVIVETVKIYLSRRFSRAIEGELSCSYPYYNGICSFRTRPLSPAEGPLTFLAYPEEYQVDNYREHERVKVELEGKVLFPNYREPMKARIYDLSRNGCLVSISSVLELTKKMICQIGFALAGGRWVSGREAEVCHVVAHREQNETIFGAALKEPLEEIEFFPWPYHIDDLKGLKAKDSQISRARETIKALERRIAELERPWWEKMLPGRA